MAWCYLLAAGLLEIAWVFGLKQSAGFTRFWPSVGMLVAMLLSLFLLGLAVRTLPLATAYAIWTGIGVLGSALIGITVFGEGITLPRLLCFLMIAGGVLGLKVAGGNG
jgi:quaternary ammonium compound-resistance protein SugE